jgi:hypothetical protein
VNGTEQYKFIGDTMLGLQKERHAPHTHPTLEELMMNYILGFAGFLGIAKVLAPLVFNLRRYTLSAADTYNILKSGPPKQTLDVCPFEGGGAMMAFTRPS